MISSSLIGGAGLSTAVCQGLMNEGIIGCANQATALVPSQERRDRGCIGEAPNHEAFFCNHSRDSARAGAKIKTI